MEELSAMFSGDGPENLGIDQFNKSSGRRQSLDGGDQKEVIFMSGTL